METEPIIYLGLRGQTGHPPPTLDLTINAVRTYHFVLGTATPVDTIHVQYVLRHPTYSFTRAGPLSYRAWP